MYDLLLTLHSLFRWVVVVAALFAVGRAWLGWLGRRAWARLDERLGLAFTVSMDVQLLLGALLYFVSPLVQGAFQDLGAAMGNQGLRFFTLEHFLLMLIAVALAHVGRAMSRRVEGDQDKHRRAAIFFGLAVILVLIAIPWPFLPYGRPLLRLGA